MTAAATVFGTTERYDVATIDARGNLIADLFVGADPVDRDRAISRGLAAIGAPGGRVAAVQVGTSVYDLSRRFVWLADYGLTAAGRDRATAHLSYDGPAVPLCGATPRYRDARAAIVDVKTMHERNAYAHPGQLCDTCGMYARLSARVSVSTCTVTGEVTR
jgi:hypothetical protein